MPLTITGTPGTGKTSVSEKLANLMKMKVVHLNEFIKENKLYERYDRKYKSYEIDPKKIRRIKFEKDTIVEGHLAHFIRSDACIVLRCSPRELEKRLKKKGWPPRKIYENIASEILDVILVDAERSNKNVIQVDTTGLSPAETAKKIVKYINEGKTDDVQWLTKFEEYLSKYESLKRL